MQKGQGIEGYKQAMRELAEKEPAFPVLVQLRPGDIDVRGWPGLTKREWIAGTVLSGILAAHPSSYPDRRGAAQLARQYADALIAELKKPEAGAPA